MTMFRLSNMYESNKLKQRTYRSTAVQSAYDEFMKNQLSSSGGDFVCALCDKDGTRISVEELGPVRVIKNDYPYEVYTGLPVREHLLIITQRHISLLGQLSNVEAEKYWTACTEYSDKGYTIVTQAAHNSLRSIPDHIHSHLILCGE